VGCVNASPTSIFVVTESESLYSFDPTSDAFTRVGTVLCPTTATPYSMAVSRSGTAYVLYDDGELFRVSTRDASCQSTTFVLGQNGFSLVFGMGFATNAPSPGETLYVVSAADGVLASIDTTTLALTPIGLGPRSAELTGTVTGALYAFFNTTLPQATHIASLDKSTGAIQSDLQFNLPFNEGWAFAAWGDVFYTFTGTGAQSTVVNRVDPTAGLIAPVGKLGEVVVGAGVSTCAP
jgi:hypothetical protein